MNLRLCNPRNPTSTDGLIPHQITQLAHAGRLYDGENLPAEARLGESEDEETCFGVHVTLWDIEEDGVLRYEAWLYMVDSGTIFRAGTTEVVAEVIQCGLECEDAAFKAALREAGRAAWATRGAHGITFR